MKQKYFNTLVLALLALGAFSCKRANGPLATLTTLAGHTENLRFRDPFGVAVGKDGAIYVSDGDTGQIWQLDEKGAGRVVAQGLNTPSALVVDNNGQIIVAETGAQVIKRINPKDGSATIIAGQQDKAGFADGSQALFNGPIGLALGNDGTIYVADTYNDRIRAIDKQANVSTITGGDKSNLFTALNTPCAVLARPEGGLVVADTGNNRVLLLNREGNVAEIAGNIGTGEGNGTPEKDRFDQPTALARDENGVIYVADSGAAAIRAIFPAATPGQSAKGQLQLIGAVQGVKSTEYGEVITLIGVKWRGLADGPNDDARISRPSGLAFAKSGGLLLADTGNRLIRVINRLGESSLGVSLTMEQAQALRPKAEDFRKLAPPRWPYDPGDNPREIAATFGELRGEVNKPDEGVWFHNGLDIPGGAGEKVHAVREEKVLLPLSVQLFETKREYIRFPTMGYIHLRIGRDQTDKPFDDPRFLWQRDDKGKLTGVRIRRGTPFKAGDPIGTLNNQFHVHLIAGPTGGEMNALAALELPGIKDTKPPFIEGVEFYDKDWQPLGEREKGNGLLPTKPQIRNPQSATPNLTGAVRIVVRAYDQMDGNAARRRLGAYRLGYQILKEDGSPTEGFAEPLVTISFETLPDDDKAGLLTYSPGSMCGYTPATILGYIVTNKVRDREAQEDFWQTSKLPAGNYKVSVFAEDFFGNRSTREINVSIR